MALVELSTQISAPIERVFDLARSIDLHTVSASQTDEKAVAGVTSGLIGLNDEVTWRARHFFIWQELTVRVTAYDRAVHFQDMMIRGAFSRMVHDHYFTSTGAETVMRDRFEFSSPLSFLGAIVDAIFLRHYMRAFIIKRNEVIKKVAESDEWQKFVGRNFKERK